jgi:hypothetical protein
MRLTRSRNDHGAALITVMLMLTLISAMLVATTTLVVKDQRARFQDHNRTETFYVAHAGLEKITNDLGRAFTINYSPSTADLANVTATPPTLGGMKFEVPGGGAKSGYKITKGLEGKPQVITTGDYAGLHGMITPYTIDVTAQSQSGSEISLRRTVNTIAIPVFQFGIFSETDLSFFPGPTFNFGGRVHTNGNLWLAKDDNTDQLILGDYVTVWKDVIRQKMANGRKTEDADYDGDVKLTTTDLGCKDPSKDTCKLVALTDASLKLDADGKTLKPNNLWEGISTGDFKKFITNGANGETAPDRPSGGGATGAKKLILPITSGGAPAISLIRRPAANENTAKPELFDQRYYSLASIRILLSDTKADLDGLAGKGTGDPQEIQVKLAKAAQAGAGKDSSDTLNNKDLPWNHWPYTIAAGQPLVGGWIKIEMQNKAGGSWKDVTTDILALGYSGDPLVGGGCPGDAGAVIRIQRYKDNPDSTKCSDRDQFWSNTLYDPREGEYRDNTYAATPTTAPESSRIYLGGIMHYVELDIKNLRDWLKVKRAAGEIMETTGYVVYFSDRRGNRNAAGNETGEYGWEDVVHRNGNKDKGEDLNDNGVVDIYGGQSTVAGGFGPFALGARVFDSFVTIDPADKTTFPTKTYFWPAEQAARASHPLFFRRALKLVNGGRDNMLIDAEPESAALPKLGLTVVAENPIYIKGDYNADTPNVNDGSIPPDYTLKHVACAVIGDAVTLLSNDWQDRRSFQNPHNPAGRPGNTTTFRTAIVSGKGMAFDWWDATGVPRDFGLDGGTHNFLRYLEGATRTLNYKGSIVSLYYNHQATGTYKCCANVYGAPKRAFTFDEDFLTPSLLPPRTPMFRTIDVTSFTRLSEPPPPTP